MNTTAIAYVRSSPGFPLDAQQQEATIRVYAAKLGIGTIRFVRDDGRHRLRGRDAMLHTLGCGGANVLLVASPCRLSSDLPNLIRRLAAIREAGARVIIANDDPTTTTTLDALIAGLPALMAIRKGMHREKAAAGRERARARGVRLGRPPVPAEKVERVRIALADGLGIRPTAKLAGVSPATVIRLRETLSHGRHP